MRMSAKLKDMFSGVGVDPAFALSRIARINKWGSAHTGDICIMHEGGLHVAVEIVSLARCSDGATGESATLALVRKLPFVGWVNDRCCKHSRGEVGWTAVGALESPCVFLQREGAAHVRILRPVHTCPRYRAE